jgi:hypothetical protein
MNKLGWYPASTSFEQIKFTWVETIQRLASTRVGRVRDLPEVHDYLRSHVMKLRAKMDKTKPDVADELKVTQLYSGLMGTEPEHPALAATVAPENFIFLPSLESGEEDALKRMRIYDVGKGVSEE